MLLQRVWEYLRSGIAGQTTNDRGHVWPTTLQYRGCKNCKYTLHVFGDQLVGSGGFGFVCKGKMVDGRGKLEAVVVKIVSITDKTDERLFNREKRQWIGLENPYILPFYGVSGDLGIRQVGMVSPSAGNGNMVDFLRNNPETNRLPLLVQVAKGLNYLHHEAEIVHGDLKGRNVLIKDDGTAMICDFGLSTLVVKGEIVTTSLIRLLNTVAFAAPELFSDTAYQGSDSKATEDHPQVSRLRSKTKETDVYAFGGMVYEAYAGEQPWGAYNSSDTIRMANEIRAEVILGHTPPREVNNQAAIRLSDELWNFCTGCWAFEPANRPKSEGVLSQLQDISETPAISTQGSV